MSRPKTQLTPAAFAIVLLVSPPPTQLTQLAVLVNGVACLLNFGKGLLPAHEARRRRAAAVVTPAREKTEDRQVEERLVID